MALHKKVERLMSLKPDLAIIPECAEPDVIRAKSPDFAFTDCEWTGEQSNKGLGVFSFGSLTLRRHQSWDRSHHIFIPIEVRGAVALNLLAVWAFNHRVPATVSPNPKTTAAAIEHYQKFLAAAPGCVAGDFNANAHWDAVGRYAKFSTVDGLLQGAGLRSAFHAKHDVELGRETDHPTHFFQRNAERGFHIDYAYVPAAWVPDLNSVTIGTAEEWIGVSDHAPLIVDVTLPGTN